MKKLVAILTGRIFVEEEDGSFGTTFDPHTEDGRRLLAVAKREIFRIIEGVDSPVKLGPGNQWISISPELFGQIHQETIAGVDRLTKAIIADKLRMACGWARSGEERVFFEINPRQRRGLLSECEQYAQVRFRSLDELFFWLQQAGFAGETQNSLIMTAWTRPIQAKQQS